MIEFRLYDKIQDIDLDEWSKITYSDHYDIVHKYALFNESISRLYNSYIQNPNQMGSIFDRIVVVLENDLKIAFLVINYFEDNNQKVLGINPLLVNPKYINKGYGTKIIKTIINQKGKMFGMNPDKLYAGIDISNIPSKYLFEKNGFKLVGKTNDEDFLYYEYELNDF